MVRLGLLIPSSNTTMEREFCEMLPKGFSVHSCRLRLKEVTLKALMEMEKELEKEALKLADAKVDVIGFGCTSGSLYKGLNYDKTIEKKIEDVSGIPAVATAGAVVEALKALNCKKVAVVTPYIDEINRLEEKFLCENGFQIVELKGLGIKDNLEIGKLSSKAAYELATKLNYGDADSVFISCTNFPTINIIQKLEDATGKSVVSSNTATLWAMLKKCGTSIKIMGYGKLLSSSFGGSP